MRPAAVVSPQEVLALRLDSTAVLATAPSETHGKSAVGTEPPLIVNAASVPSRQSHDTAPEPIAPELCQPKCPSKDSLWFNALDPAKASLKSFTYQLKICITCWIAQTFSLMTVGEIVTRPWPP